MSLRYSYFFTLLFGVLCFFDVSVLYALESTAVLPKNVRRVQTLFHMAEFDSFTDSSGKSKKLASSLEQPIYFKELVEAQSRETAASVQAFLKAQGVSLDTAAGGFVAGLKAGVQAVGLSFAWGVTDKLTVGVGAPFIRAETRVAIGLQPTEAAKDFLLQLQKPEYGQRRSAALAVREVNAAPEAMQELLQENGYKRVEDWRRSGFGDTTVVGKYKFFEGSSSSAAVELGVVMPTGATDDPDILTDIPLGDGQWDMFSQVVVDSKLFGDARISASLKYTEQLAANTELRLRTANEMIEVENAEVKLDRGSKLDLGLGYAQPLFGGLSAFGGYKFSRRAQDIYSQLPEASKQYYESEKGKPMRKQTMELGLGYSTLQAFKKGKFSIPFIASTSYTRQTAAKNTAFDADSVQLELSVFF